MDLFDIIYKFTIKLLKAYILFVIINTVFWISVAYIIFSNAKYWMY